jgi:2-phosphosulfolactate phosphatase
VKVTVFFTVGEVGGYALQEHTAVVIDVLRATSTVVAALAAGAEAIYPVVSVEDAVKLATSLGRKDTLLAGERGGRIVAGFDLGNSPAEFTPGSVGGKRVVMSTTNGTAALVAASAAERVVIAAYVNLRAVTDAVAGAERVAIVCAGREGRFCVADALCAGILVMRLRARLEAALELDDAGWAALALATVHTPHPDFLLRCSSGAALASIGLAEDVRWCARDDVLDLVPELSDRMIRSRRGA